MNKQEFLDKLKKRLDILSETEVKDILDEYSDTIDQKIQEGMSEEDAVKDFGNIDDLANDILEAYKINTKKKESKSQDAAQQIGDILQQIVNYLEKFFTTLFNDLSVEKVSRTLVLTGVAVVLIFFLNIPFVIGRGLITGLLKMLLPFGLGEMLAVVVQIILSIVFLVLTVLIIISFVRVGVNNEDITVDNLFRKPLKDGFKFDENTKTEYKSDYEYKNDVEEKVKTKVEQKFEKKYGSETDTFNEKKPASFGGFIISGIVWFMRFVAVIILMPLWMTIVGLSIVFGLLVYLWVIGIPMLGLILILLGFIGLFNTIASVFSKLVFSKRQTLASVAGWLVFSSILIGVGLPITLNNLSELEPIYITTQQSLQYEAGENKFEVTLPYSAESIYDFGEYNLNFVFDENLTDSIVIEGYGDPIMSADVAQRGDNTYRIYVRPALNSFSDFKLLADSVVGALKDGYIYQYDDDKVQLTIRIPKGENKQFKYYDRHGNITIEQEVLN